MILTTHKAKLPQTHSFPVSAELLSEALSSVPQFELLKLTFYGVYGSKNKGEPHDVLTVNHLNFRENQFSPKHFTAKGFYEDTWEIIVRPVLRKHKAEVKRLLIADGLPKVKVWLSARRTPAWLEGRKTLSVMFDESSQSLKYNESSM